MAAISRRALCAGLIVFSLGCIISAVSHAAEQGQWGRTSTATVKITLRILPPALLNGERVSTKATPVSTISSEELREFACEQPSSGKAQLAVMSDQAAALPQLLANYCNPASAPINLAKDTTLLIAPL